MLHEGGRALRDGRRSALWTPFRPRRTIALVLRSDRLLATRRSIIVDHASTEAGPGPLVDGGPGVVSGSGAGPDASSRGDGLPTTATVPRWAWFAFALLFAMHLL